MLSSAPNSEGRAPLPALVSPLLFAVLALGLAISIYVGYLPHARQRWDGIAHDRFGHFHVGLKMATALRHGNVVRFLDELERCKVWPPAHALLLCGTLLLTGNDHTTAVLPSLAGWVLSLVCGYLTVRRMTPERSRGPLAGVLAFVLIATSPAHRVFATDVMLESLGTGLTMLALYLYLVARQSPIKTWAWHGLAVTLTVLFFEKYNYWTLVSLAFAGDSMWTGRDALGRGWVALRAWNGRALAADQLRQPLPYAWALLVATVAVLFASGPTVVQVAGHRVSLYPPNNLVTVAYAVGLVHLGLQLWRRRELWSRLQTPIRALTVGHLLPLALSFLLPQRLSAFAWYVGPANQGEVAARDPLRAIELYWRALFEDYHAAPWCAVVSVVLCGAALGGYRRLRPGAGAVLLLVLVSGLLTVLHPNHKSRFLHSWLPALWVAADVGLTSLLTFRPLVQAGPRRAIQFALVAALVLHDPAQWWSPGHSPEAGHRGTPESLLDITDRYLPCLDGARTAFLSTLPCRPLLEATYLERFDRLDGCEYVLSDLASTPSQLQQQWSVWLQSTQATSLVFVDVPPKSRFYLDVGYEYQVYRQLTGMLAEQDKFREERRWDLSEYGCTVTLWRRRVDSAAARFALTSGGPER